MKATMNNGIDYILTATNECNDRQIEQMVGKAMCAYANMLDKQNNFAESSEAFGDTYTKLCIESLRSEYEATIRCIALFVDQPTSHICQYVISRCKEEFGIQ